MPHCRGGCLSALSTRALPTPRQRYRGLHAFLTPRRTIVAVASARCHTATATSALEQTREQTLFRLALVTPSRRITSLNVLDLLPQLFIDDGKNIDLSSDPFAFRIEASDALACFWVLEEALPIVCDPAGVQFVVEYPIPPQPVPVDR
jgi:hypothetical protein